MSNSTFVPIGHNVIRSGLLAELSPTEFVVWLVLRAHCGRSDEAWPRQSTISRLAGLGSTAVKKAIRSLAERRLVVVQTVGRSNRYTIRPLDTAMSRETSQSARDTDAKRPIEGRIPTPSTDDRAAIRPDMGRETSTNRDAKRLTEEEPSKNNQEPSPPKTANDAGAGVSFEVVGSKLQRLGLTAWRGATSQAKMNMLTAEQTLAVIDAYDPTKWSLGALSWRLKNAGPAMAPTDGWPTPKEPAATTRIRIPQYESWRAAQIKRLGPSVEIDDSLEKKLRATYERKREQALATAG